MKAGIYLCGWTPDPSLLWGYFRSLQQTTSNIFFLNFSVHVYNKKATNYVLVIILQYLLFIDVKGVSFII